MRRVGERVLVIKWIDLDSEPRPSRRPREAVVVEDRTRERHSPLYLVRSRGEERVVPAEWLASV